MTLVQHSSGNSWLEPGAESEDLPVRAFLQEVSAGIFTPATTGSQDAAQVDIDNNGIYKPLDLNARLYFIDVAGVPTLSTTGTEAYILVEDGNGVLQLSTDFTETPTAEAYADGDGRYITTGKDGADGLQLTAIGSTILPYL